MLVGDKTEELVLEDGAAEGATHEITMQLGILQIVGNIHIVLEEEGGGIDPVRATTTIECAVICVRTGGGAHINVCTRGGTLLRVIHRSVDTDLGDRLRSRSRNGIANREIDRGCGLN